MVRAGNLSLKWLVALVAMLAMGHSARATAFVMHYSGRIANSDGSPKSGPVSLEISFHDAATGGNALGDAIQYSDVALQDGLFSIELQLEPEDYHEVLSAPSGAWIQVKDITNGTTYPRQRLGAVPFALKIPIDQAVLGYDDSGRLGFATPLPTTSAFLKTDGAGNLIWEAAGGSNTVDPDSVDAAAIQDGAISNADISATAAIDTSKIDGLDAALAAKADTGHSHAAGDITSGTLSDGVIPAGIARDSELPQDTDDVGEGSTNLYFTDARARGALSASGPLSLNGTTGEIAISQATGVSNGYLSAADWLAFDGKADVSDLPQNTDDVTEGATNLYFTDARARAAFTPSTDLTLDQLTAQTDLRLKDDGNEHVVLQAPATVTSTYTLTLPVDGGINGQILSSNGNGELEWINAGGGGDMLRGTYDSDENGVVNNAEALDGLDSTHFLDAGNLTGTLDDGVIPAGIARDSELPQDTDDVGEGSTNLYFTDARARGSLSPSAPLTWNATTGALGVDVGSGAAQVAAGNHTHSNANSSSAGFMSAADKNSLDSILNDSNDWDSAFAATNSATSTNTANTLVERNALGNFAANTITADLIGDVTGNVSGTAASFTGSLSGDVTGTQTGTVVSSIQGKPVSNADPTSGQTLVWNGTDEQWEPLTLSMNEGTVTSIVAGAGLTGGTITDTGTIAVDVGTSANKIVQLDSTGKLPAVDGSNLLNLPGRNAPKYDFVKSNTQETTNSRTGVYTSSSLEASLTVSAGDIVAGLLNCSVNSADGDVYMTLLKYAGPSTTPLMEPFHCVIMNDNRWSDCSRMTVHLVNANGTLSMRPNWFKLTGSNLAKLTNCQVSLWTLN